MNASFADQRSYETKEQWEERLRKNAVYKLEMAREWKIFQQHEMEMWEALKKWEENDERIKRENKRLIEENNKMK